MPFLPSAFKDMGMEEISQIPEPGAATASRLSLNTQTKLLFHFWSGRLLQEHVAVAVQGCLQFPA